MRLRIWMVGMGWLSACQSSTGTLRVDVRTDLQPIVELETISVELQRPGGGVETREHSVGNDSYLDGVRVGVFEGLENETVRVVVTARGPGIDLEQRASVAVRGDTGATLLLTRNCLGVACDAPEAETCLNGMCVSSTCTAERLESCGAPACSPDACGAVVECAGASCESGACLVAPLPNACPPGERCDLVDGCTADIPDASMDAGLPDATGDAGFDALTAEAIVVGRFVACARLGREVVCWGNNVHGAVGHSEPGALGASTVSVAADEIAASATAVCARDGGAVHCWGDNRLGQLGQGDQLERRGVVVDVPLPFEADGIDAFSGGFCAHSDGMISCWGSNAFGQADPANPAPSVGPGPLRAADVVHVDGGADHLCFRTSSDDVFCQGRGLDGELGDGSATDSRTPIEVTPISAYSQMVAIGPESSIGSACALASGQVFCWGANNVGQLGSTVGDFSPSPVAVTGLADAVEIFRTMRPMFARTTSGQIVGWGDRRDGLFGDGGADRIETTPAPTTLGRFRALAFGEVHACGIEDSDNTVWCWGRNDGGTLPEQADDAIVTPFIVQH